MRKKKNIVIGSCNMDMVIRTISMPQAGETVMGDDFIISTGGKGANQTVAAIRLGADVFFIAKLGKDIFGNRYLEKIKEEGINDRYISIDPDRPTGVASIILDSHGENIIVVAPGANSNLSKKDIDQAMNELVNAEYVLTQLETPIEVIEYLVTLHKKLGFRIILNPAPAKDLDNAIFEGVYLLTPNETEAQYLTGIEIVDAESAEKAGHILLGRGVENVVITLGQKGALLITKENAHHAKAPTVNVVDTTGAGDAFNGALLAGMGQGKTLKDSVDYACRVAALAVTALGAQNAMPTQAIYENYYKTVKF